MTATIIDFPVVKRPPAKKPISRKERLDQIFNEVTIIQRLGLGPEDGVSPRLLRLAELIPSKHDPDGDTVA